MQFIEFARIAIELVSAQDDEVQLQATFAIGRLDFKGYLDLASHAFDSIRQALGSNLGISSRNTAITSILCLSAVAPKKLEDLRRLSIWKTKNEDHNLLEVVLKLFRIQMQRCEPRTPNILVRVPNKCKA